MTDFKFKFVKQVEIIVEAVSEEAAWMQIAQINPETLGAEWDVSVASGVREEEPLDQGPVEIDDWGPIDEF